MNRFLLAQQHMDLLARKRSRRDVEAALNTLPKELDATYDEAITRIDEQSEEDRHLASRILSWVVAARRPMTMTQLQIALAVSPGDSKIHTAAMIDEEILLSVSCDLVVAQKNSRVVSLIHGTARTYFDRIRDTYLSQADQEIASTCLTLMLLTDCRKENWYDELGEDAILLVSYAVNTWGFHAIKGVLNGHVGDLITRYLRDTACLEGTMKYLSIDSVPKIPRFRSWRRDVLQRQMRSFSYLHLIGLFQIPIVFVEQLLSTTMTETINQCTDGEYWAPLAFAIRCGHRTLAEWLINDQRTNINAGDGTMLGTALHVAINCMRGDTDLVKFLILRGADVHTVRRGGEHRFLPLQDAAEAGDLHTVKLLLAAGSDGKAMPSPDGMAPLYRAARGGNTEVLRFLFQQDQNVNMTSRKLGTPLHGAAFENHEDMIKLLLELGADPEIRDISGISALDVANYFENVEAANALRAHLRLCLPLRDHNSALEASKQD